MSAKQLSYALSNVIFYTDVNCPPGRQPLLPQSKIISHVQDHTATPYTLFYTNQTLKIFKIIYLTLTLKLVSDSGLNYTGYHRRITF